MPEITFPDGLAERLVKCAPERFRRVATKHSYSLRFTDDDESTCAVVMFDGTVQPFALRRAGAWALSQLDEAHRVVGSTRIVDDDGNAKSCTGVRDHTEERFSDHSDRWISAFLAFCLWRESSGELEELNNDRSN